MISYFGAKWRSAVHYQPPKYDTLIEPFAGGAGYALHYPHKKVILVERDERIAAIWQYLLRVKPSEILALPLLRGDQTTDDLDVCEEARLLIGFWIHPAVYAPRRIPSAWMKLPDDKVSKGSYWGVSVRARIARQVEQIRHWRFIHGDYTEAPDIEATWFIDPPYQRQGKYYRHSSRDIDFPALGDWCVSRKGEVVVCENLGADWLPFDLFRNLQSASEIKRHEKSKEVVWYSHPPLTLFTAA